MPGRVRRMTADEVEALLSKHGFQLISQRGSHRKWRNTQTQKQVIVSYHRGQTLPIGTLRSILDSTGIPDDQWKDA